MPKQRMIELIDGSIIPEENYIIKRLEVITCDICGDQILEEKSDMYWTNSIPLFAVLKDTYLSSIFIPNLYWHARCIPDWLKKLIQPTLDLWEKNGPSV